ncbi:MAG: hypothetical protein V7K94_22210 [Nostoc sp.]|uniref:hypothetical protein n=1 Tax=Nostoc sp. TaxID=1180 RepID=UPI002FF5A171
MGIGDWGLGIGDWGLGIGNGELRRIVGWVERSETQQSFDNVGFRSSTQPTPNSARAKRPAIANSTQHSTHER